LKSSTAIAHPNFALIKYWGKSNAGGNIPAMSSLAVTLDNLMSETTVSFPKFLERDTWILNDIEQNSLGQIQPPCDYLKKISLIDRPILIESKNNFPTAAGLASSASGIASLITALDKALETNLSNQQMVEAAILGSGSSARSLFSGFVHLEVFEDQVKCETILEVEEWPLNVIVCITSTSQKEISSRQGMEISKMTSPIYKDWVSNHHEDIEIALKAIQAKDFYQLGKITELNCLKMHNVMKTSKPSIDYWNQVTHRCVEKVKDMQQKSIPVFFTIDAGPQVKIICEPSVSKNVMSLMRRIPGVQSIIKSSLGKGARIIHE
jgi:diphosphomevalonate decarboxylase